MPDVARGHNEGSIFYRKRDRRWVAQVTMPDGSRPSRSHPEKAEARRLLRELLRKRDQGLSNARDERLGSFLESRWLPDVRPRLAPKTWRRHEQIVRLHIVPYVGHIRLSELSVSDCRRLFQRLGADMDAQTVRHVRATLRRGLADAQREGLVERNTAALAEPPPMKRRERTHLDADQLRTLIDGTRGQRMHALYVLALTTGMREAEMLGLTWADIHFGDADGTDMPSSPDRRAEGRVGLRHADALGTDARPAGRDVRSAGTDRDRDRQLPSDRREGRERTMGVQMGGPYVRIRRTLHRSKPGDIDYDPADPWVFRPPKTDKSDRTVSLTPEAVAVLKWHRAQQRQEKLAKGVSDDDASLVFTSVRGHPIHGNNILPEHYRNLERLGLPRVTWHDLRHSCATVLYEMGVDRATISDLLGHSTTRVFEDLYRHRVPKLQQEAARAMSRALGGAG